jgi:hypothetical protein
MVTISLRKLKECSKRRQRKRAVALQDMVKKQSIQPIEVSLMRLHTKKEEQEKIKIKVGKKLTIKDIDLRIPKREEENNKLFLL